MNWLQVCNLQGTKDFYIGYTTDLRQRIAHHNEPFDANRRRLGAQSTVHGQPWVLWAYVKGFGGATPNIQAENARRFEGLLIGDHVNRKLTINEAERKIQKHIRIFTEKRRHIPAFCNIELRRVEFID